MRFYKLRLNILLFTITILLNSLSVFEAQSFPLLTNIEGRQCTSLNGTWKYLIDPMDKGLVSEFYLDNEIAHKSTYQSYDFNQAESLTVPGDWNTQLPELLYYEGTIWCRKKFEYKLEEGRRLFLHFGAVNYESTVYLNGKKLGQHIGGYTPFNFEITENLRDGENSLVVHVNNERHSDGIPEKQFDWWNYGGITRPVALIEASETFIRDYSIQLSDDRKNIEGWVQLDGPSLGGEITLRIPELKINCTVNTDVKGRATFKIKAKPEYWSPENPKLYSVNVASGLDEISEDIGFRTIETKGKKILLNGKQVFLRGVNAHAQIYGRSAYSEEDAMILLSWAKDLGCNFLRLAHYPHSEAMIKLAEQMGIMVWEEVPVYWRVSFENPNTYANAQNQLEEMITRDKNRANVIIWSLANENL